MGKKQAALGEWESPISSELIVSKVSALSCTPNALHPVVMASKCMVGCSKFQGLQLLGCLSKIMLVGALQ